MNFQLQKYSCFQWDKKEESNAQIDKFLIIVKRYAELMSRICFHTNNFLLEQHLQVDCNIPVFITTLF